MATYSRLAEITSVEVLETEIVDCPLSIVIPAYQRKEQVTRCILSILESDYSNFEIILIDDGSSPSLERILPEHDKIRYFRMTQRNGAASARNRGVAESSSSVIYFLDSDAVVEPCNLRLVASSFRDKTVRAMQGITSMTPLNEGFIPRFQSCFEFFLHDYPQDSVAYYFNPRNAAIRKEDFLAVGGFDPHYTSSLEEFEFSSRLLDYGVEIGYQNRLIVRHSFPETVERLARNHFSRGFTMLRLVLRKKTFFSAIGGLHFRAVRYGFAMHLLMFLSFLISFFSCYLLIAALIFITMHFYFLGHFYCCCLKVYGVGFLIKAVAIKLLLSLVLVFSLIISLISVLFYKKPTLEGA